MADTGIQIDPASAPARSRVLLVGLEADESATLAEWLRRAGYEALPVDGVAPAADGAPGAGYDLVILDRALRDITGAEALPAFQARAQSNGVPVIVVTSGADNSVVLESLQAGAADYLARPLDPAVAIARVRAQLARQRALPQTRDGNAAASEAARDVGWHWNPSSGDLFLSPDWCRLTGVPQAPEVCRLAEWLDRVHPGDMLALRDAITEQCTGRGSRFLNEHRLLHSSGAWRWVRAQGAAARDASGAVVRLAGSISDITEQKVSDSLTGLPNRLLFMERLSHAAEAARAGAGTFAVLFLDLDRFKHINESLGHMAGDELLMQVADRLRASLRAGDTIARNPERISMARFGGDEFVILADSLRDAQDAALIAQRVVDAFVPPFTAGDQHVYVSVSIGVATWSTLYRSPYELLRDADTAMSRAKAGGKGRFEVFQDSLRTQAVYRLRFENELRKAVDAHEFSVAWQPIVNLETTQPVALEVLLRWPGFHLGECRLEEVIQVAEETGLILELGRWVLEQASAGMGRFHVIAPSLASLIVNVNVSARQLLAPNFVPSVLAVLQESGLQASSLKLEVTESTMMSNASQALDVLQRIKCLGVRLSIDDFGTGFSSLSYLHQFPFDTLKLDRSFLQRSSPKGKTVEVVRAVIHLAHALGMDVVAEGIETEEQAHVLRGLGCEFGQGFFFACPMSTSQMETYLEAASGLSRR